MPEFLDLTDDTHRLADEQIRHHRRDRGVSDEYRCHIKLAEDWDGKTIRFTDPFAGMVREPYLKISSSLTGNLAYKRIPPSIKRPKKTIEIFFNSPMTLEAGTQFYLSFKYRRSWRRRLLKDFFAIGVSPPAGSDQARLRISIPVYYRISACKIVEKKPMTSTVRVEPKDVDTISRKDPVLTRKKLKEIEGVVRRDNGDLFREYQFFVPLEEYERKIIYKLAHVYRFTAMCVAGAALPLLVAILASMAILSPDLETHYKFLITFASMAFGPPFVIAMRQIILKEAITHSRGSVTEGVYVSILFLQPLILAALLVHQVLVAG
jgi:hypothetical protein